MAILMYLSTKMTPQTSIDPSQQNMMSFMPLMMAAFFFNLSSGLNLYMFTSNLIGVGQQYYLNRTQPLPAPKSKFKKKKRMSEARAPAGSRRPMKEYPQSGEQAGP